jgi:hypothetical protein
LERLEDRTVPATFTAATVPDLIADITAANQAGGSNIITLAAGTTFTLTAVDNQANGATGLPAIAAGEDLTILGYGATIERSSAAGTLAFRLFDVDAEASLTLQNLTLQGGLALGVNADEYEYAQGGAVYNQGALTLRGVIVQNNTSHGFDANGPGDWQPGGASGGGLYSSGLLTLEGSTIQNNGAVGGRGGDGRIGYYYGVPIPGAQGGNAYGGGLFVAGGTVTVSNSAVTANTAQGGDGGDGFSSKGLSSHGGMGGGSFGGGLSAAAGTVALLNVSITLNSALGGQHGVRNNQSGQGVGGGLYIEIYGPYVSVGLDAFTVDHLKHNRATSDNDVAGPYDVIP